MEILGSASNADQIKTSARILAMDTKGELVPAIIRAETALYESSKQKKPGFLQSIKIRNIATLNAKLLVKRSLE